MASIWATFSPGQYHILNWPGLPLPHQRAKLVPMVEYHPFEQRLAQQWAPASWRDVTVLVAVSGGADSVALLLGLHAVGQQPAGHLVVAHFNHQLRGRASDGDAQFVQQLSDTLDLRCEIGHAEVAITTGGDGLESAARAQRYQFLRKVGNRCGARFVATAHTADDQAETILHRIVRGTGLAGLAGIPVSRQLSEMTTIVRPMLGLRRSDVLDYLTARHQPFREDESNASAAFTRNRIRHQLLPMLAQQFNPQVVSSLLRLGDLARESQQVIDAVVDPLLEESVTHRAADHVELACTPLVDQSPFLVRELLIRIWKWQDWPRQDMGELRWRQLCDLIQSASIADQQTAQSDSVHSSMTLPGNIRARRDDQRLTLHKC